MMKHFRIFFAGFAACALLLPASQALAMTVRGGEDFILPEGVDVNDDLYVGASNAVVNGVVNGDLFLVGGNVTVANRVAQDLNTAGGNITVNAEIGDDLRAAGGSVDIFKNVKGDVLAAGGTVHVLKDATVEGDLVVAGGLVIIDGTVKGNVLIAGGQVSINGTVEGAIQVNANDMLTIGPGAQISQKITYRGRSEANISEGASVKNGIEFTRIETGIKEKREKTGNVFAALFGIAFLANVLILLTSALIAVYAFKKFSSHLTRAAMTSVGQNMLRGFGFLILTPIALLLLFITVLGAHLAAIGAAAYCLVLLIAKVFAGILTGAWIMKLSSKGKDPILDWKTAFLGVIAFEILALIPLLGWLGALLIYVTVLGALYSSILARLKQAR